MKSLIFGVFLWLIFITTLTVGITFAYTNKHIIDPKFLNFSFIFIISFLGAIFIIGILTFLLKNINLKARLFFSIIYTLFTLTITAFSIYLMIYQIKELHVSFMKLPYSIYLITFSCIFGLLSIIPVFTYLKTSPQVIEKTKNTNKKEKIKKNKNSEVTLHEDDQERFIPLFSNNENFQEKEQAENNILQKEFTSTPNEETFNPVDKLAKLKENIQNNNFVHDENEQISEQNNKNNNQENEKVSLNWEETNEQINSFVQEKIKNQDQQLVQNQQNQTVQTFDFGQKTIENPSKKIEQEEFLYNNQYLENDNQPKDPYKQTIIPRRSGLHVANKFSKPIGNVASVMNQSMRKSAKVDRNYEGKVFLGDSDRIWEAMKKQERRFIRKEIPKQRPFGESNIVNSLKIEKTIKIGEDLEKVLDPINSSYEEEKSNTSPTIEWY